MTDFFFSRKNFVWISTDGMESERVQDEKYPKSGCLFDFVYFHFPLPQAWVAHLRHLYNNNNITTTQPF